MVSLFVSCVTLSKFLSFSVLQFPHLYHGRNSHFLVGMLDKMVREKLLNMAWHVARAPSMELGLPGLILVTLTGGWAAESAAAEASGVESLYSGPCGCGGGKAALLSSSGYQLLKAARGTAGFKGACPCFGEWCFQPLGWRWAQRSDIELRGDREAALNGVQGRQQL